MLSTGKTERRRGKEIKEKEKEKRKKKKEKKTTGAC